MAKTYFRQTTGARTPLLSALLACVLVACGGGGGAGGGANLAAAPAVNRHKFTDRIEPLDTKSSAALMGETGSGTKRTTLAAPLFPTNLNAAHVTLAAPSAQQLDALRRAQRNPQSKALQVGFGRDVAQTAQGVAPHLDWVVLGDGSRVAALTFQSTGAAAVRIAAVVDALPAGAALRFFGVNQPEAAQMIGSEEIAQLLAQQRAAGMDAVAAHTIYGPFFEGDSVRLEIHIPAAASADAVRVAVPQLQHLAHSVTDVVTNKHVGAIGAAEACHWDAVCHAPADQRRAVAKFLFRADDDGGIYACSGTLMNNTADDKTPYFTTAAHCVDSATEAASMETYWFFHSAACGQTNTVNPNYKTLNGGAQLLYTKGELDFTLVKLRQAAPAGVLFSGSYHGDNTIGLDVEGIHHPAGDLQKFSAGKIVWTDPTKRFWHVKWHNGTTEGGASGSGLLRTFDGKRYLVGVLFGGGASCADPNGVDMYGRFDSAYKDSANSTVRDKLRPR